MTVHGVPLGPMALRDFRRILTGASGGDNLWQGSGGCALRSNLLRDAGSS